MNTTTTHNTMEQGQADEGLTAQQRDVFEAVDALLAGLGHVTPDLLPPPAARLFQVAREIPAGGAGQRLGQALLLSALAESPEAVMAAIRTLRAEFVAADPLLAALR